MAKVINGKKAITKLFKQMSFLGDILIPARVCVISHDAHTGPAHLKEKTYHNPL